MCFNCFASTLREGAGSHFEPAMVETFLSILPRILEIKAIWDEREARGQWSDQ